MNSQRHPSSPAPSLRSLRSKPRFVLRPISLAACLLGAAPASFGLPQGATANGGQASVTLVTPKQMQITQTTPQAGLDWTSFSIAAGERVNISQPSARAVLINRVLGNDPSQIHGALSSNGQVWLVNPRGIYFGAGSQVDVGGLVATTLAIGPHDQASGRLQLGSAQSSSNDAGELRAEGSITAIDGSVLLVAPRLLQSGRVQARRVGLAAASEVLVDVEGDGLIFFNARNDRLDARLSVLGNVLADGGTAELRAAARAGFADTVLNLEGVVRARSLGQRNGRIVVDGGSDGITRVAGTLDATGAAEGQTGGDVLVLGQKVMLDNTAVIDASGAAGGGRVRVGGGFQGADASLRNAEMAVVRGGARVVADATAAGDGGQVVLWADNATRFHGAISARGGATGGGGGNVEVSGKGWLDFQGTVDTQAPAGKGGTLLLDPLILTIRESNPDINGVDVAGTSDLASQTIGFGEHVVSPESFITFAALNTQLNVGAANVILDAQNTINVESAGATVVAGTGRLTLRAGNGITIGRDISADGGITLSANHTGISAAETGIVQLTGNLTASSGTITITNNGGSGTHSLNGNLSADALSLTGNAAITGTRTWNLASGTSTVNANLSGSGDLIKAGGGTLELGGSNSYGATSVTAGVLSVAAANNLGSGGLTLNGGNLLASASFSLSRNVTLGASGGSISVGGGNELRLANPIDGAGALVKTGTGTLTLQGARNYVGTTTINDGTLSIAAGGTNTANITLGGNTLDISGDASVANPVIGVTNGATISNSSGGGTLTDSGTLALVDGANLNLSSSGTGLAIARLIADGAANNSTLTITGSAPVTLSNPLNSYGGDTRVGVAGAPGTAGTLRLTDAAAASGAAIVLRSSGAVLDIAAGVTLAKPVTVEASNATIQGSGTLDNTGTLALGDGFNLNLVGSGSGLTVNRQITDSNDNATVTVSGSAAVTLGNTSNTHGGGTRVQGGGVLAAAAAGALGNNGVLTLDNGTLQASSGFTFGRNVTLAAGNGVFDVPTAGQTLTLSGDISGAGDLNKTGAGTLLLSGSNSYDQTTFTGGTLSVANATNLGSGALTFAGGTLRASNTLTLARNVTINAGGATFNVNNGDTLTLQNAISGAGSLTKAGGTGTLVLEAASSHAGTIVSAGTLTLRSAGTVGSGDVLLDGVTSTLRNERTTEVVVAGTISGTGTVEQAGNSVLQLNGNNTYSGDTVVSLGTVRVAGSTATAGTGTIILAAGTALDIANGAQVGNALTVADGATISNSIGAAGTLSAAGGALALSNGDNLNLSASGGGLVVDRQITDGGADNSTLTITGSAPVTLSNPLNSYGGDTRVGVAGAPGTAGTLRLTNAAAASGAAIVLRSGGAVLDIAAGVTLAKPVTVEASNATIQGSGTLDNTGTLALGDGFNLNLVGSGSGLTVNRQITDSNDNATVTVSGSAAVTLGNTSNTHGGGTRVQGGGVLAAATAGALGNNGVLTLDNGTLQASSGFTFGRNVTLAAGNGVFDVPTAGQTLTLSGAISGAGDLNKTGAGTLVLSGSNSYGQTTFSGGILSVAAVGNLGNGAFSFGGGTLATSESFTLTGFTFNAGGARFDIAPGKTLTLQNSGGTGGVTKVGDGMLVLAGTTSYAGNTVVDAGTLRVSGTFTATGSIALGANTLDIAGGATLVNALTVADGATISNSSGAGTLSATGGPLTLADGANLNLSSIGSGLAIERLIADGAANNSTLTITGSAPVTLSNPLNSYGGDTRVGVAGAPGTAGTLRLTDAAAASGAAIVLRSSGAVLDIAAGVTLARPVTVEASNATIQGSGTLDNTGTLALGDGFNLNLVGSGSGLAVNRQITDSNDNATVTVSGSAAVTLGNTSNTHGGGSRVQGGGVLKAAAAGALGNNGVLTLDNGTLQASSGFTFARDLTLAAGGGAVDVASGQTLTLSGAISGAGDLNKTGAGTLVLSGSNSYDQTTFSGGILSVAAIGNLGSGSFSFGGGTLAVTETLALAHNVTLNAGGGTFDVSAGKTLTLSNPVGGAGNLTKTGSGTLVLDAAGSYAATAVNAGVLSLAAADRLGSGTVSFGGGTLRASETFALARNVTLNAGGGSFEVASGKTLTLPNSVSGTGDLIKLGGGTLVLAGSNSYGATHFDAGAVSVAGAGNLGSGTLDFNGGNLLASGSFTLSRNVTLDVGGGGFETPAAGTTLTLANPVSGAGSLLKSGAGTLVLEATNSYGGGTTVNAGTLRVGSSGAAGSGTIALGANTLDIVGGATVGNTLTVSHNATIANSQGSGTLDATSTLLLGAAVNLNLNSSATGLTINRQITDSINDARLTITGSAPVTLGNAANSYGGGTSVRSGGRLAVTSAGNLGDTGVLAFDNGSLLAGGSFTLARNVDIAGGGATFDVATGATLTLANPVAGSGGLAKTGAGTLVLAGTNAYGTTSIGGGVLSVAAAVNIGGGALSFNGGSLLASDSFTLARDITLNAGGGSFNVANGKTLTLANAVGGAGSLEKQGAGRLVLAGSNSYAGTTVNGGVLSASAAGNLGLGAVALNGSTLHASDSFTLARNLTLGTGGGSFDVDSGKTLTLANVVGGAGDLNKLGAGRLVLANSNSYAATRFSAGAVSVSAAGNLGQGALVFEGGVLSASSSFTLARDITLNAAGGGFETGASDTTLTLANPVGGPGGLVKSGAGTLVLQTSNGYSGGTTVSAGVLRLAASGAAGSGGIALGAQTLDIVGGATVGNALTLADGATLRNSQGSGTLDSSGTLALAHGANLNLASSADGLTIARTMSDGAGSARITVTGGSVTLGADNNYDGGSTLAAGATLQLGNGGTAGKAGSGAITNHGLLRINRSDTLTIDAAIGGSGGLEQAGGNNSRTVLTAANSYSGGSTVSSGTLAVSGAGAGAGSASIVLANGNAVLDIVNGASVANAVTSQGATIANSAGSGSLDGALTLAANSRLSSTGTGLTIAGSVADGSGGSGFGIEKVGSGSVTLASAGNSYRGSTTVSAGTLRTSGDERIADSSAVVVNAGELALGGNETIASLAGAGGTVSVPVALHVGAAGTDTSFAGVFSGAGAVEKIGAGSLSLGGSSTAHTGTVTVSNGTLSLAVANALGSGSSVVVAGGTLALAGNHQSVAGVSLHSGSITGSGGRLTSAGNFDLRAGSISAALAGHSDIVGLDKTTSGSVTLSGAATYRGETRVSAGTLNLSAADAVPATTRLIVNGGEFNIGALDVVVGQLQLQSGSVTGSGTLTAGQYLVSGGSSSVGLGDGVLESSGITTLTGPTQASQINVNAGVLTLAQNNVLSGTGRTVTVAANATLVNNGDNQAGQLNLAGTLSGTGTFRADDYALDGGTVNAALGAGALTSSGSSALNANVAANSVVVNAGTLAIGSAGQLTNAAADVTVRNAATLQLSGPETIGRLTLAGSLVAAAGVGPTLSAQNYALDGGSVHTPLGSGALTSTGSSTLNAAVAASSISVDGGVLALNLAQQLTAAPTVSVAGGATLALAADQTAGLLAGSGAVTLGSFTLTSGGAGNSTFQGTLSGSGSLVKQGSSTFTLSGDNQQARTRVAGGTLALSSTGHLADGGELEVDAGATLQLAADESVGSLRLAGRLTAATGTTPTLTATTYTLAGATVDSALGAGALSSTGSSVLNAAVAAAEVIVNDGTLTLNRAQQLSARPALTIAAAATLALGADQTAGTLSGSGAVTLADHVLATGSGGDSSFSGTLSGSGTLLKQGPSTFTLAGDNRHGRTHVAAGTLLLAAAQRLADTGTVQVDSGARLQLSGDESVGSLLLAGTLAGSGTLHAASYRLDGGRVDTALGGGELSSNGGSVLNASAGAGSVRVDSGRLTLAAPQLLSPQAEVTVASGAVLQLDGIDTAARLVLRGNLAGSGTFTATSYELDGGSADAHLGSGTLVSRGNSSLRGSVAASAVNVLDGNLQLSTAQQLQQLPAVDIAAGARVTLGADQSFGSLTGGGQLALASFTLASGAGGDSTFAGVIDGDGGFIKRGASVFTLTGANSWRGRTVIDQGTLRVGDNGSTGSLGSGDIQNDGSLVMARSDEVTLAQAVSGSGSVEQQGSGRLRFSGSNKTYSGATRVLAGELATGGADNLPDNSAVSVAAGASLVLGGRETLQSVAADGSVSLAGDLVASGELALRGAVTVPGDQTLTLSGTRIDAVNAGNRWGAALGFVASDSITLSSGLDGANQRPLTLAAFSAAAGGRIDAGKTTLAGSGVVSGGQLVIASDAGQSLATSDPPPVGKVVQSRPVAYTADAIVQGTASRLEVAAGAELSLLTPAGASIQLGRLDNQFNGNISAIAGSATAPWAINTVNGTSLQNRVRIGGSAVNVGGAGVIADVVDINADTLATRGGSTIVARLPFDRDVGTTVSLPALTLTLTQRSFTLTFPYGNTGVEGLHVNVGSRSWGLRTSGPDAGYITVLPRGGGTSGNTAVLLVGPNVNAGGYGFFFDGASVQGEVPVYYNGVLPATPQVENSISATVAVSEAARKQRFDEAVRTENVALRLRAGVIAEVGPAPSATQGPEGARLPATCPPAAALSCSAQP